MKIRQTILASAIALAAMSLTAAHAGTDLTGTATADDAFFAYVSTSPAVLGTSIGSGDPWYESFSVSSAALSPGTYYLEIEAINAGGPGGFSGVFTLSGSAKFSNGSQTLTTDPGNLPYWYGSYNNANSSFTPQTWIKPTGTVDQDQSYGWGNIAGTPNWIWPSDPSSSPGGPNSVCGYCTVDLTAKFTVPGVPEPATWAILLLGFFGIGFMARTARRKEALTLV